ncbi:MAG TPA: 50S ribosomal protein L32, partial [Acidimicrobiales bacterium]|nr:50S ribosomal protein L32 [Acidimicrobiales bacterium]
MAVPKKKTSKAQSRSRRASAWTLRPPAQSR